MDSIAEVAEVVHLLFAIAARNQSAVRLDAGQHFDWLLQIFREIYFSKCFRACRQRLMLVHAQNRQLVWRIPG